MGIWLGMVTRFVMKQVRNNRDYRVATVNFNGLATCLVMKKVRIKGVATSNLSGDMVWFGYLFGYEVGEEQSGRHQ